MNEPNLNTTRGSTSIHHGNLTSRPLTSRRPKQPSIDLINNSRSPSSLGLKHSRQISMGDLTLMGKNNWTREKKPVKHRIINLVHHSLAKKQEVVNKEKVNEKTEEEKKVGEMKLNYLSYLADNLTNKANNILCKMSALKTLNAETHELLKEFEKSF